VGSMHERKSRMFGLMGTVANAVLAAGGEVTGVIPRQLADWEVAHRGLTELEIVGSMHERKSRMFGLMGTVANAVLAAGGEVTGV
ncbi:LOG family protein, partial [Escherichia coli]|uniref:LOG family protein n=1 Tax=Escherichia coli TaxID=562 RepID=UPI0015965A37